MAVHTFAGVTFRTEWSGHASVPIIPPGEAVVATEHIPGGDRDVTQDLGRRAVVEFVVAPVLVDAANWAALVALNGQSGTLALIGNPTRPAKLTKIGGDIRHVLTTTGYVYRGVSLTFLVG